MSKELSKHQKDVLKSMEETISRCWKALEDFIDYNGEKDFVTLCDNGLGHGASFRLTQNAFEKAKTHNDLNWLADMMWHTSTPHKRGQFKPQNMGRYPLKQLKVAGIIY